MPLDLTGFYKEKGGSKTNVTQSNSSVGPPTVTRVDDHDRNNSPDESDARDHTTKSREEELEIGEHTSRNVDENLLALYKRNIGSLIGSR